MYATNLLAQNIVNAVQNPAFTRFADYGPDFTITGVPGKGSVPINTQGIAQTVPPSFQDPSGKSSPFVYSPDVTDINKIAPTHSIRNVLTEGIANAALRQNFDFDKSFTTKVLGSGQPGLRDASKTYDYSGYKLGNPASGKLGLGREFLESVKTMFTGDAPNIVANTLGDYTARYTPKLDPNHPEVLNIYDEYDFKGKGGEGWGDPYNINVNLSPQMIEKIKRIHMIRRKKMMKDRRATQKGIAQAAMQKKIQQAQAAGGTGGAQQTLQAQITAQANREARERVGRGEARDYGHTQTRSSSGWRSDPMWQGGRAGFQAGGIVDLYRQGGF